MYTISENTLKTLTQIFIPVTCNTFDAKDCAILSVNQKLLMKYTEDTNSQFKFYWYPKKLEKVIHIHKPITYTQTIIMFLMQNMHIGRRESENNKIIVMDFANGATSGIEKRWEQFVFYYNNLKKKYTCFSIIYSAMIHRHTNDPIINFVTAFPVDSVYFRLPENMHQKYKNFDEKYNKKENVLQDLLKEEEIFKMPKFRYKSVNENNIREVIDLNESEILNLPLDEGLQLIPINEEARMLYLDYLMQFYNEFYLPLYQPDEDGIDDYYYHRFNYVEMTPEMEKRRLKYNHQNVYILNDLVDSHFKKYGEDSIDINTNKPYHNVVTAIGHGFPQKVILKYLCDCFGEKPAKLMWRKYYRGEDLPR